MTFKLWADENMTQEIGILHNDKRMQHVKLNQNTPYVDFVFYFGSPDPKIMLQTVQNAGVDLITLQARSVLPQRQSSMVYQAKDVVELDGWLYQAQNGGSSTWGVPVFTTKQGAQVQDGVVSWLCLGRAHSVGAVSLSLSSDGLPETVLSLGTQIRGGAAVPIYVKIHNSVSDVYDLPFVPQMALFLNDCEIIQAA